VTACADYKMLRHEEMLEANAERSTSNVQRRPWKLHRIYSRPPPPRFAAVRLRGRRRGRFLIPFVGNDVVPLVGGRPGDEGDHRLGLAHVEYFMRHTRFDVNEIAGLIFDHLFQSFTKFVTYFSFDDVQNYFKADMDVRICDASRRDGGDVCRQVRRSHIFPRHALLVMNAVPITSRAATANGQNSAMIFDRLRLDVVFPVYHLPLRKKSSSARL